MITLLMGNRHQKMMIAFRCFDPEDNEFIMAEDVKYLLKHVPLTVEERHGISFGFYDQSALMTRHQIQTLTRIDHE